MVLAAVGVNNLTDGVLNTFVVALIFGIALRTTRVFKPQVLGGIDSLGLMMLAILILVFGPLATLEPSDLVSLAKPLVLVFVFGLIGIVERLGARGQAARLLVPDVGVDRPHVIVRIPGTMVLSQEAARAAGETEDERKAIEGAILPKMIVAASPPSRSPRWL